MCPAADGLCVRTGPSMSCPWTGNSLLNKASPVPFLAANKMPRSCSDVTRPLSRNRTLWGCCPADPSSLPPDRPSAVGPRHLNPGPWLLCDWQPRWGLAPAPGIGACECSTSLGNEGASLAAALRGPVTLPASSQDPPGLAPSLLRRARTRWKIT